MGVLRRSPSGILGIGGKTPKSESSSFQHMNVKGSAKFAFSAFCNLGNHRYLYCILLKLRSPSSSCIAVTNYINITGRPLVPKLWGSILKGVFSPKLSAPPSGETKRRSEKFSRCQNDTVFTDLLYHHAEYFGHGLRASPKKFNVFRLRFLCVTLLNGKEFEREIAIKLFELRNDFDTFGQGEASYLCIGVQLCLYSASWRHHRQQLKFKRRPNQGFSPLHGDTIKTDPDKPFHNCEFLKLDKVATLNV